MAKPTPVSQSATSLPKATYCPNAGEFIWLDFRPQAGREQSGRRCALVLTPRTYNQKTSLCVVCPTTNQKKGYPFEVSLPIGFPVSGVVLCDHVKSLDWNARRAEFICKSPPDIIQEVLARLKALLAVP